MKLGQTGMAVSMLGAFLSFFSGCAVNTGHVSASLYVTTADQTKLLEVMPPIKAERAASSANLIALDPSKTFQEMDGFGASFTESSGYAISSLTEPEADSLLTKLFDPQKGIGITFLRQPMGSPDFALSPYSYDDVAPGDTDFALKGFSIDRDRKYILPYLKKALEINPSIKIMATPWSPPAWMKTGRSLMGESGGSLRKDCYAAYAQYFVRFIKAYGAEGIPIYAVTPQNEIHYAPAEYSGMMMTSAEEVEFIGGFLGPALAESCPGVKIFCYDHNWDHPELPIGTLSDPAAAKYAAGSAWHYYAGNPRVMTDIHERFPDKGVWFTEGGSGKWIGKGTFSGTFKDGISKGIDICSNWAKSFIWWNIALDQNNGPIVFKNTANYGLVEVEVDATGRGTLVSPERACFYTLAHFSKFVKPGAVRIGSSGKGLDVSSVAFRNPDGSTVAVVYNRFAYAVKFDIGFAGAYYGLELPEFSAATLVWGSPSED